MTEKGSPPDAPVVWALVDDRAGNRSQCLGVAEALGLGFAIRELSYGWAGRLPNVLLGASFAGLTAASRAALRSPWPGLVVTAGRRTAPVARAIKRLAGGRTFLVQVMDPGRAGAGAFDLIAQPRHDLPAGRPGTFPITGAPHRITPSLLNAAAQRWRPRLKGLPRPWIALIVGGSTRRRAFDAETARTLGRMASAMARDAGGSLLVSTSRRTGAAAAALSAAIDVPSHVYRWGEGGDNPYPGYLALADAVVVTGDSVSMCSEACATAGPVYIYAPTETTQAKHARLHAELFAAGYARPMTGALEAWSHPPLNPAAEVAREIRRRLGLADRESE